MTFERSAPPAEPGATPVVGDHAGEPTPVQIRLQILSTEHWSLLASRGLAWNESFSRASMYLSTLSGALVALGLIGGVDGFHDAFFVVALVVLPVVLFVGIGTWLRMGATNYHDAVAVVGMNRIRAAYVAIDPGLAPYFLASWHDDRAGLMCTDTMGAARHMVNDPPSTSCDRPLARVRREHGSTHRRRHLGPANALLSRRVLARTGRPASDRWSDRRRC